MGDTIENVLVRLLAGEDVDVGSLPKGEFAQRFRARLDHALSPERAERILASIRADLEDRLGDIADRRLRELMRHLLS